MRLDLWLLPIAAPGMPVIDGYSAQLSPLLPNWKELGEALPLRLVACHEVRAARYQRATAGLDNL